MVPCVVVVEVVIVEVVVVEVVVIDVVVVEVVVIEVVVVDVVVVEVVVVEVRDQCISGARVFHYVECSLGSGNRLALSLCHVVGGYIRPCLSQLVCKPLLGTGNISCNLHNQELQIQYMLFVSYAVRNNVFFFLSK